MKIPVFHDDQHGTAIIASAAVLNGLRVVGKDIAKVKLVCSGAGAAAIACLDLLVSLGLDPKNVYAVDSKGVIHTGRENLDPSKARYAQKTDARTWATSMPGADMFPRPVHRRRAEAGDGQDHGARSADPRHGQSRSGDPPEEAKAVRPDAIIGTGRSDYPNQVNNVLCFPFMFRGALDVGATTINEAMKVAAVRAIAELAHAEQSEVVTAAYGTEDLAFGPEYLIPKPFDPRLIIKVAPAVAQAAMDSGVATRPIADMDATASKLNDFVYHTGLLMRPVFAAAKKAPARIVFCEGEDERVLRAAQVVRRRTGEAHPDRPPRGGGAAHRAPRPAHPCRRAFRTGQPGFRPALQGALAGLLRPDLSRKGVGIEYAKREMRRRTTLIGAMLVRHNYADGMLCGTFGKHSLHLRYIEDVIGRKPGIENFYAMNMLVLPKPHAVHRRHLHQLRPDRRAAGGDDAAGAEEVRRFGLTPRWRCCRIPVSAPRTRRPRSRCGARWKSCAEPRRSSKSMARCTATPRFRPTSGARCFPNSTLKGQANLLIMPTLDAANIAFNLLKTSAGDGLTVGPMLLGAARPVHVLTPTATVRRIVNVTALLSVEAQQQARSGG
jgi:malate dehydrogenase (oxaloacetate-decarboxylating)(NADP+)